MKIFLDDVRSPRDCTAYMYKRIGDRDSIYLGDWMVVRNYDEFVDAVKDNIDTITHVSFDHDLSTDHYDPSMYDDDGSYNDLYTTFKEKTGYECAKWMKDFYSEKAMDLPTILVHSMNPVGVKNINGVFNIR